MVRKLKRQPKKVDMIVRCPLEMWKLRFASPQKNFHYVEKFLVKQRWETFRNFILASQIFSVENFQISCKRELSFIAPRKMQLQLEGLFMKFAAAS